MLYNIILLETSIFFHVLYDYVTIILNSNSIFQNKKINKIKIKMGKKNKVYCLQL